MSRALAERLVARRAPRGQVDRLRDPEGVWLDDWMPIWTEGAVHRAEITPGAGVENGRYAHTRIRAYAHTK
jgi:hypothetical protein